MQELCPDDMQLKTILSEGHLDNSLRMCVKESVDQISDTIVSFKVLDFYKINKK